MRNKKNILFITKGSPNDYRLWSGTVKSAYSVLSEHYNLEYIDISGTGDAWKYIHKLVRRVILLLSGKKYYSMYSVITALAESRMVQNYIKGRSDIDFIFCPAQCGSIAYLKTDIKIIYFTDATFAQMIDYYDYMTKLSWITKKCGNIVESKALKNSHQVVCASDWCKNSVSMDYEIDSAITIPLGANLITEKAIPKAHTGINLLFCGVDWERKGGSVAVDTAITLRRWGYDVKLYLVGCSLPKKIDDECIIEIGFLNKNDNNEKEKLIDIYRKADFLLLPTKAECAGVVFAEACGYGIPSITYDTGGVGTYVIDGYNGYKLPPGSDALVFAKTIAKLINNPKAYKQMKINCVSAYETKFNWNVWSEELRKKVFE